MNFRIHWVLIMWSKLGRYERVLLPLNQWFSVLPVIYPVHSHKIKIIAGIKAHKNKKTLLWQRKNRNIRSIINANFVNFTSLSILLISSLLSSLGRTRSKLEKIYPQICPLVGKSCPGYWRTSDQALLTTSTPRPPLSRPSPISPVSAT